MRRSAGILVVMSWLLAGCASLPPGRIAIGPFDVEERQAFFDRTRSELQTMEYAPEVVDPTRGRFTLVPHEGGHAYRFQVQLYRDGWIQVALSDRTSRPVYKAYVPDDVSEELVTLSIDLRRRLSGDEGPSEAVEEPPDE